MNLPQAFNTAGLAIATILIAVLCLLGYMAATFVTEAMAAANAYAAMENKNKATPVSYSTNVGDESDVKVRCGIMPRVVGVSLLGRTYMGYGVI